MALYIEIQQLSYIQQQKRVTCAVSNENCLDHTIFKINTFKSSRIKNLNTGDFIIKACRKFPPQNLPNYLSSKAYKA